jgi:caffeoyl-CoA O-methyltransferase
MADLRSIEVTPAVYDYLLGHSGPVDEVWRSLTAETSALGPVAAMQIGWEHGRLLSMLVQLTGARRLVEVGTFTGSSALALARGLPADGSGSLLCCDVSEEWTAIARRHWALAEVADRIELRIAPGAETLASLPADRGFDLAFLDADKSGYITYYEEIVRRMGSGGLVIADNVLWSGRVADPADQSRDTMALRAYNDHVAADPRVDTVTLPVGNGLLLARVR